MTLNTKDKIIQVANELFSKNGYEGTSIRDIANKAGANVAAVNYHFNNKQALYWEIFLRAHATLEDGIKKLVSDEIRLEDLSVKIYEFMLERSAFLKNTFKLFLSEAAPIQKDDPRCAALGSELLPPGGKEVLKVVNRELKSADEKAQFWVVKGIFTYCVHWALKSCSSLGKTAQHPEFQPDQIRKDLRHQVRSMMAYIKANPNL